MKFLHWLACGGIAGAIGYELIKRLRAGPSPLVLRNSVVLITGASSGIGRAYARAFARRRTRIVLAARRPDLLENVRQDILPDAADVLTVPTDVTDSAQLRALVDQTLDRFGQIDVLINNAGVDSGGPLHVIPQEVIRRTVEVNLSSAICLASLCLPSMLIRGRGWIVNVSSGWGAVAGPFTTVYSASKHGLIAFSDALRRETDGTGIRVISVLPYWTYSEMITPDIEKGLIASHTHIDRAEDVAEMTIRGLLEGRQNIYFGGRVTRFGIWVERHFPALVTLYWRMAVTPEFIAMSRAAKG